MLWVCFKFSSNFSSSISKTFRDDWGRVGQWWYFAMNKVTIIVIYIHYLKLTHRSFESVYSNSGKLALLIIITQHELNILSTKSRFEPQFIQLQHKLAWISTGVRISIFGSPCELILSGSSISKRQNNATFVSYGPRNARNRL